MSQAALQEVENHEAQISAEYQARIDSILSRPLAPEYIDSYADVALDQLIAVVQDVTADYKHRSTPAYLEGKSPKEVEVAAFDQFGLSDIESILDHVADKADEIHSIDAVIAKAKRIDRVITPPDPTEGPVKLVGSEEGMQAKALIPRLKTTLFILSSQFGVDLNDPKQLSLIPGEVTPEMVRKVSYYLIEAHNLGRSLLVCDEAENASFIFDSKYLEELGFKSDDLLSLTKNELKEYIEQYPDMGRRMLYTSRFVSNMINAIESPQSTIISEPKREITLVPISPASERIESSTGISKKFEIPPLVINKAIMSLEEEGKLGEVGIYKFVSNTTRGYTPEQQDTIFQWLQDNELLIKKPPEGVLSMRGLRHNLGISSTIAEQAIEALRGTPGFGPVKTYRFQKPTHGYTPEQQAQILQWVIEKRQGASVEMPEDYKSMSAIVKTLNVDHPLTERLINELQVDDKFGIPQLYSLKGKPVRGFSPEQQAMIKDRLQQAGAFLETAPEGYLSFTGLGELLGIDKSTIKKYADIAQKTGAISDIRPYKFYSAKVPGLSPEQQAIIIEKLRNSGALLESPPEDYLSVKGLARKLGIDPHSLDKQVKALQETGKLHGMRYHKFGSVPARALSPSQQEIVANSLREQ